METGGTVVTRGTGGRAVTMPAGVSSSARARTDVDFEDVGSMRPLWRSHRSKIFPQDGSAGANRAVLPLGAVLPGRVFDPARQVDATHSGSIS